MRQHGQLLQAMCLAGWVRAMAASGSSRRPECSSAHAAAAALCRAQAAAWVVVRAHTEDCSDAFALPSFELTLRPDMEDVTSATAAVMSYFLHKTPFDQRAPLFFFMRLENA